MVTLEDYEKTKDIHFWNMFIIKCNLASILKYFTNEHQIFLFEDIFLDGMFKYLQILHHWMDQMSKPLVIASNNVDSFLYSLDFQKSVNFESSWTDFHEYVSIIFFHLTDTVERNKNICYCKNRISRQSCIFFVFNFLTKNVMNKIFLSSGLKGRTFNLLTEPP